MLCQSVYVVWCDVMWYGVFCCVDRYLPRCFVQYRHGDPSQLAVVQQPSKRQSLLLPETQHFRPVLVHAQTCSTVTATTTTTTTKISEIYPDVCSGCCYC